MHNTYLVLKHEIKTTLAKRSFWVTTFVFPLMIMALTLGPQLLAGDAIEFEHPGGVDAARGRVLHHWLRGSSGDCPNTAA